MEVHTGNKYQPDKPSKMEGFFVAAPSIVYESPSTYDKQDFSQIGGSYLLLANSATFFIYLHKKILRKCA